MNTNGWSQLITIGYGGTEGIALEMSIAVAAAALVPVSSTSI